MNNELVVSLLVVVLIAFLLFLALRELYCWYFKINRIVELLEAILQQLRTGAVETVECPFCREQTRKALLKCDHCDKVRV